MKQSTPSSSTAALPQRSPTVVLGALVAAREVFETDASAEGVAVTFALIGVMIAAVSGLEAAFRLTDRAAQLRALAVLADSTRRHIDTQWRREVQPAEGADRAAASHRVMDYQDQTLNELQTKAAELGINLPYDVEQLMDWSEDGGGPYAA